MLCLNIFVGPLDLLLVRPLTFYAYLSPLYKIYSFIYGIYILLLFIIQWIVEARDPPLHKSVPRTSLLLCTGLCGIFTVLALKQFIVCKLSGLGSTEHSSFDMGHNSDT